MWINRPFHLVAVQVGDQIFDITISRFFERCPHEESPTLYSVLNILYDRPIITVVAILPCRLFCTDFGTLAGS